MKNNRFSKPVAFNSSKATDQQILNYVKKRNFSGYVKNLILADMSANSKIVSNPPKSPSKFDQLKAELNRLTDNVNDDSNCSSDTQSD
ncbi:hypothetical protein [Viridibacillus arvi]|uniref:hypothetical protein n=1 Tax=Viridibacillus arvi TaxID=263475 RepID=UPI0034CEFAC3